MDKSIKISSRIVLIFVCAMVFSVIPEYFPVFGDWVCEGSGEKIYTNGSIYGNYEGCTFGEDYFHKPETHWGYRHWLFCMMGLSLFITQVVFLIGFIDKETSK